MVVFKITIGSVKLTLSQEEADNVLTKKFDEFCYSGKDCLSCPVTPFQSRLCVPPFETLQRVLLEHSNKLLAVPEKRDLSLVLNKFD